jgi:hypothetical protein
MPLSVLIVDDDDDDLRSYIFRIGNTGRAYCARLKAKCRRSRMRNSTCDLFGIGVEVRFNHNKRNASGCWRFCGSVM